jgi:hypothetical protein
VTDQVVQETAGRVLELPALPANAGHAQDQVREW